MNVDEFVEELKQSMDCGNTTFFGKFTVPTAIAVTWLIMLILMILTLVFVRNLKVQPTSKIQMVIEALVEFINNFFTGILGEEGKCYIPYLGTVLIYGQRNRLVWYHTAYKRFECNSRIGLYEYFSHRVVWYSQERRQRLVEKFCRTNASITSD